MQERFKHIKAEAYDKAHDEAHEKLRDDMTETERQILNYCVEPKSVIKTAKNSHIVNSVISTT